MRKTITIGAFVALSAMALAMVPPSLSFSSPSATFGGTSGDTVTYTSNIEVNATYSKRQRISGYNGEFYDSSGNFVAVAANPYVPAEFVAECTTTTTGAHAGGVVFNGLSYLQSSYWALPPKIRARVATGRYGYFFVENLADGCSGSANIAATDSYTTAWSSLYSLP